MERGNVRADVNVSLRSSPDAPLGTRTETKNVNSFRSIERAVRYEMSRQAAVLDGGGSVLQETRHFHEEEDRKSTRLNSSHVAISYAVFCLKKKTQKCKHTLHQYTPL